MRCLLLLAGNLCRQGIPLLRTWRKVLKRLALHAASMLCFSRNFTNSQLECRSAPGRATWLVGRAAEDLGPQRPELRRRQYPHCKFRTRATTNFLVVSVWPERKSSSCNACSSGHTKLHHSEGCGLSSSLTWKMVSNTGRSCSNACTTEQVIQLQQLLCRRNGRLLVLYHS